MSPRSGNGTPSGGTGDDRIAIVGVGCRFPGGVRTLDSFGRLLSAGGHVFTEVPRERWGPERSAAGGGPISNGVGAFLDDIDRFDAAYFGVTPREANLLDPQQRLILEVAWEAMSDSGRPREAWRGSRTAVMLGLLAKDYELLHARTLGVDEIGQHHISGMEFSFSACRLAYTFDLRGPVSAVNSACSSSLLAVHQACQSLRADDCDTAVAGGVSLLVTPDVSVFLSKVGAISPSGRCTPFDAAADGIVRGEGAGAVVLKRLADAVADRDRIYAVIRGSAANNDGTSLGLTVPNAAAQAELLARALHRSGLAATDVDYVEAHGTGTAIGDMMELEAIGEVYGAGRDRANPVLVGSHKALLGHMDAAAGIGGLLKSTWVVHSGLIPRQPYVRQPNPAVDWRDGALSVPPADVDLAGRGRAARAGVSSFGLSGTNVHVIVEAPATLSEAAAAPDPDDVPAAAGRPLVLLSSASGAAGLSEQVVGVRELVDGTAQDALADLSAATATRRTHEAHRFAVVAADREQALACLEEVDEPQDGAYAGVVPDPDSVPAPVFVFSGQGGQWPGMAMDLYGGDPVVREALEECAELIRAEASWSLLDHLRDTEGAGLERTEIVQPGPVRGAGGADPVAGGPRRDTRRDRRPQPRRGGRRARRGRPGPARRGTADRAPLRTARRGVRRRPDVRRAGRRAGCGRRAGRDGAAGHGGRGEQPRRPDRRRPDRRGDRGGRRAPGPRHAVPPAAGRRARAQPGHRPPRPAPRSGARRPRTGPPRGPHGVHRRSRRDRHRLRRGLLGPQLHQSGTAVAGRRPAARRGRPPAGGDRPAPGAGALARRGAAAARPHRPRAAGAQPLRARAARRAQGAGPAARGRRPGGLGAGDRPAAPLPDPAGAVLGGRPLLAARRAARPAGRDRSPDRRGRRHRAAGPYPHQPAGRGRRGHRGDVRRSGLGVGCNARGCRIC